MGISAGHSITISDKHLRALDRASKLTNRTRDSLVDEVLEQHLSDIVRQNETGKRPSARATGLMAFAGAGVALSDRRSSEAIDLDIREMRDDDRN